MLTARGPATEQDYLRFEREGYLSLGRVLQEDELRALRARAEDIMLGRVVCEGRFFQRDAATGRYEDVDAKDVSYSGPSLDYRKVKDLEYDEVFLRFLQNDAFRRLSERFIGPAASCMRAMLMNKPSGSPTVLPYHQDVSAKWQMSKPAVLTLWTALDDATRESGCVEIVPGSHRHGQIGAGHMITPEEQARHAPPGASRLMELRAGEAFAFSNALLHRSGPNTSGHPRRAFTVCLMHPDTEHLKTGRRYPLVFGPEALRPESVRGLTRVPGHVYE